MVDRREVVVSSGKGVAAEKGVSSGKVISEKRVTSMKSSPEKEVASKKTPERPSERTSKKALPKDVLKEKPLSEK